VWSDTQKSRPFGEILRVLKSLRKSPGVDPACGSISQSIAHLRNDEVTDADIEFLNTRVLANLSPEERAAFADALHLCPTNALVDDINIARLGSSNKPVLIVPAMHTGPGATKTSEDDAEGLQSKLLLMEGAKVMLTRNIWTSQGLTNGTMGVIGISLLYYF
jgi:hypothetical protein